MEQKKVHRTDAEQRIILLHILNGAKFQQEKQPYRKITLTASLEQNVLETVSRRPVSAGSGTATFNNTLVWVCDTYSIKNMKTRNVPIKVECFETLPDGGSCRIGHVIIPLRSVQVTPLSRKEKAIPRWYRLINIESERWRKQKPELNMQIMITEPGYLESHNGKEPSENNDANDNPGEGQQATVYVNPSTEQLLGNAELLENRGLLQIGRKDTDKDLFVLSIELNCGRHLDRFVPGSDTFHIQYHLFGEVYPLHVERNEPGSAVFAVQGNISMRIRSSLSALGDYLQNFLTIPVELQLECDPMEAPHEPEMGLSIGTTIGKCTIDFLGFLKETNLEEFKRKYANKNYTLEVVRNFPIHPFDEAEEKTWASNEHLPVPTLKCSLALRFLSDDGNSSYPAKEDTQRLKEKEIVQKDEPESSPVESFDSASVSIETKTAKEGENDQPEALKASLAAEPTLTSKQMSLPEVFKNLTIIDVPPAATVIDKVDIPSILQNTDQDLRDIRRTFAFSVRVGLIKFTSSPFAGLWQLTLQHPKADTSFTRVTLELTPDAVHPERIDFGDITLKLLFSTLPERVMEVIESEPSKLTLNGPHGMHILARLDNGSLLVGTREQQPSGVVVMVDGSTGENVAIATISCCLEEVGLNYNSQLAEAVEKPPLATLCCRATTDSAAKHVRPFDETVSYQMLEEQKAWMNEQRAQFLEELKEKERIHLQSLTNEWKVQRAEEEKRLANRLALADAMASALEEARRTLEDRDHEETRIGQLEQRFQTQLEAIRSKALRVEREAEAQIEVTRKQCHELQDQLATLSTDNQHLIDVNAKLQRDLDQERVLRGQEVSELRQTLEDIAASKLRYKEDWAKLTRKVHQLEQELAVARTPYYQPQRKEQRKPTNRYGDRGSQMSVSSSRRHGAGDCSSCNFYHPPDSCQ